MGQWQDQLKELIDAGKTAVLVVDMQRAFTAIPDLFPPISEMVPRLTTFLDIARSAGVMVVTVRIVVPSDVYSENWQRQFSPSFQNVIGADGSGTSFHAGFEPRNGDILITKFRYSGFYGTSLASSLRTNGIHTVLLCGLTTDVCVGSTARDAYQQDFHVITLSDCTAEVSREQHESALATLAMNFGLVCTSTEVIDVWQRRDNDD